jgi:periplasmic protein TonB
MAATTATTRARWERWRIETARPYRGRIATSLTVHAVCAALAILLAVRIERNHRAVVPEFIKVTLLPGVMPMPEILANPAGEGPHRVTHMPVHVEAGEPVAIPTPDVQVVPDATSSAGAIALPRGPLDGTDDLKDGSGGPPIEGNSEVPVAVDAVAHPPEIVTYVVPKYPRKARAKKIQGRVLLMVIVDESGKVEKDVTVVESIPMLDKAAVNAIHRWRFSPGRDADGNPIRVRLAVPVRFSLR